MCNESSAYRHDFWEAVKKDPQLVSFFNKDLCWVSFEPNEGVGLNQDRLTDAVVGGECLDGSL